MPGEQWLRELSAAWEWRERARCFDGDAVRVFHGPGEGSGILRDVAVDRFGATAWITQRESDDETRVDREALGAILAEFLAKRGLASAVALWRPRKGVPDSPVPLFGEPPAIVETTEAGAKFLIRFQDVKHPGLFLDHAPLRQWLRANTRGLKVLNTFAYTGSLSVAAGLGGASHVTTLDLSRPTIEWAEENWALNGLAPEQGDFIYGDVFEWLPKFARRERRFELVILDPPSFSRGKKANFSTSRSRDVRELHGLALDLVADRGVLATSINSANVSAREFERDVRAAAEERGVVLEQLVAIELPVTFREPKGQEPYLKGGVFRVTREG